MGASGLKATDATMTQFFKKLNKILYAFQIMIPVFLDSKGITNGRENKMNKLFTELDRLHANRKWRLASGAYRGVYNSMLTVAGTTMSQRKISPELEKCLQKIIKTKTL